MPMHPAFDMGDYVAPRQVADSQQMSLSLGARKYGERNKKRGHGSQRGIVNLPHEERLEAGRSQGHRTKDWRQDIADCSTTSAGSDAVHAIEIDKSFEFEEPIPDPTSSPGVASSHHSSSPSSHRSNKKLRGPLYADAIQDSHDRAAQQADILEKHHPHLRRFTVAWEKMLRNSHPVGKERWIVTQEMNDIYDDTLARSSKALDKLADVRQKEGGGQSWEQLVGVFLDLPLGLFKERHTRLSPEYLTSMKMTDEYISRLKEDVRVLRLSLDKAQDMRGRKVTVKERNVFLTSIGLDVEYWTRKMGSVVIDEW